MPRPGGPGRRPGGSGRGPGGPGRGPGHFGGHHRMPPPPPPPRPPRPPFGRPRPYGGCMGCAILMAFLS